MGVVDDLESLAVVADAADAEEEASEIQPKTTEGSTEGGTEWEPIQPSENAVAGFKMFVGPAVESFGKQVGVEYEEAQIQELSMRIAAVSAKYGAEMPAWLIDWYEEIMLARLIASIGYFTFVEFKKAAKEKDGNGDKSKHEMEEPEHVVSSEIGRREVASHAPESGAT